MAYDINNVKNISDLICYFSQNLGWNIDIDDFDDIEDVSYDFEAEDIGLKEESFAKISSLRQLQPLVDGQQWGIFCVEFDSDKYEASALKKILSGLIPRKRNSVDHAVWCQQDLLFICNWGKENNSTIGLAHFEDRKGGLPQIKMFSCAPALEDFTQTSKFEQRLSQLAWPKNTSNIDEWRDTWSNAFATVYKQTIQDSSILTVQLAAEAQNIRNRMLDILSVETENGYVHLLFQKFRNTLIHDMTEQQFADMYAQTVVYGLFSARCMDSTQDNFSAAEAVECIPSTNPFLKSLMKECLGAESTSKLSFDELEIGNVVDLLIHTETDVIIQDFNRQTGGGREDPVIHFYEEFLTAYDKEQKVKRGVYYTPQPVVNFIVCAVDSILKSEFGYEDGLASTATKQIKVTRKSQRKVNGFYRDVEDTEEVPAVQILDPATGTGTFLRQTILQIYENFQQKHKGEPKEQIAKAWNIYVDTSLLPRLNGFELMMAPYAVAHMKLAMVLKDTGYDFSGESRLNIYLTNSLEQPGTSDAQITLFDDPLAIESVQANDIKKNGGINVIIGNPPYSGESANKGNWIMSLMEGYKKEPGGKIKLQEKNSKWLNDDYVKFIRYAQSVIDRNDRGVLAYINPHGFIVNPTFRGMRWNLMQTFDQIYVMDLHGNSNRKEACPDGSKDENVFDIQQGVAICIMVKSSSKKKCRVFHSDVYGSREIKYDYLNKTLLKSIQFKEVYPEDIDYMFAPVNTEIKMEYDKGFAIDQLFTSSSVGIVTSRDALTIDFNKQVLKNRIDRFRKLPTGVAREEFSLGKDVCDWKVSWAQADVNTNGVVNGQLDEKKIVPIMYRIFDKRYIFYTGASRGLICRPRTSVMQQFIIGNNIALATARSNKSDSCDHFYVVNTIMEAKCAERTTQSAVFPLYSYSLAAGKWTKTVNFNINIVNSFSYAVGLSYSETNINDRSNYFSAEDLFYYIYGVLFSRHYRKQYYEFLKTAFPKIPFAKTSEVFWKLRNFGYSLSKLHLMNNYNELDAGIEFHNVDGSVVLKVIHKDGKVFINKDSYFSGVTDSLWYFLIGGYQPLQHWLKERRCTSLSNEDVLCYCQMIQVIKNTISIMDEIDSVM